MGRWRIVSPFHNGDEAGELADEPNLFIHYVPLGSEIRNDEGIEVGRQLLFECFSSVADFCLLLMPLDAFHPAVASDNDVGVLFDNVRVGGELRDFF